MRCDLRAFFWCFRSRARSSVALGDVNTAFIACAAAALGLLSPPISRAQAAYEATARINPAARIVRSGDDATSATTSVDLCAGPRRSRPRPMSCSRCRGRARPSPEATARSRASRCAVTSRRTPRSGSARCRSTIPRVARSTSCSCRCRTSHGSRCIAAARRSGSRRARLQAPYASCRATTRAAGSRCASARARTGCCKRLPPRTCGRSPRQGCRGSHRRKRRTAIPTIRTSTIARRASTRATM